MLSDSGVESSGNGSVESQWLGQFSGFAWFHHKGNGVPLMASNCFFQLLCRQKSEKKSWYILDAVMYSM